MLIPQLHTELYVVFDVISIRNTNLVSNKKNLSKSNSVFLMDVRRIMKLMFRIYTLYLMFKLVTYKAWKQKIPYSSIWSAQRIQMATYNTFYMETLLLYHTSLPRKVLIPFGRVRFFSSEKMQNIDS